VPVWRGVADGDAVVRIQNALADLRLPSGSSVLYTGEHEEQKEAQRDFSIAIVMALILVYMLMASSSVSSIRWW
jgi:HAE1 family hydrophobic/amphiphilic exporter-1